MTKRAVPKGQQARVRTETKEALSPIQEKVVRMRQGYGVADHEPLGRVGQDRPEVAQKLLQMELRALEKSGRLAQLREAAGVEVDQGAVAKQKIVAGLKEKAARAKKR